MLYNGWLKKSEHRRPFGTISLKRWSYRVYIYIFFFVQISIFTTDSFAENQWSRSPTYLLEDVRARVYGCPALSPDISIRYVRYLYLYVCIFLDSSAFKDTCAASRLSDGSEEPKVTSCVVNNWPITGGLQTQSLGRVSSCALCLEDCLSEAARRRTEMLSVVLPWRAFFLPCHRPVAFSFFVDQELELIGA